MHFPWFQLTSGVPCLDLQVFKELKQFIQQYEASMNQTEKSGCYWTCNFLNPSEIHFLHLPIINILHTPAAETAAAAYASDTLSCKLWSPGINMALYYCVTAWPRRALIVAFEKMKIKRFTGYKVVPGSVWTSKSINNLKKRGFWITPLRDEAGLISASDFNICWYLLPDFVVLGLTEDSLDLSTPNHIRKSKRNSRNSAQSAHESAPHVHADCLGNVIASTQPALHTSFILHATESTCTVTAWLGFLDWCTSENPVQITKADRKTQEGSKQPPMATCHKVQQLW